MIRVSCSKIAIKNTLLFTARKYQVAPVKIATSKAQMKEKGAEVEEKENFS